MTTVSVGFLGSLLDVFLTGGACIEEIDEVFATAAGIFWTLLAFLRTDDVFFTLPFLVVNGAATTFGRVIDRWETAPLSTDLMFCTFTILRALVAFVAPSLLIELLLAPPDETALVDLTFSLGVIFLTPPSPDGLTFG